MMNFSKAQKKPHGHRKDLSGRRDKNHRLSEKINYISMSEAREIAKHVLSGIAWSG